MNADYRAKQLAGITPSRPSLQEVREQPQYQVEYLTEDHQLQEAGRKYPSSLYGKGTKAPPSKVNMTPGAWYQQRELFFKAVKHTKNGKMSGVMFTSQGRAAKESVSSTDVWLWTRVPEESVDMHVRNVVQSKIDGLAWERFEYGPKHQRQSRGDFEWKLESRSVQDKRDFVKQVFAKHGVVHMPHLDPQEYPKIRGMEGPFQYRSGRVLYYDPREGRYYDSKSDMYLDRDDMPESVQQVLTPAQQTLCKAITNKIGGAKESLDSLEKSLSKFKSDPNRYQPQLDNMRQDARSAEVAARSIAKLLSNLK